MKIAAARVMASCPGRNFATLRIEADQGVCGICDGRHGATDLSPITMGCALHFDTWVPNCSIQEYMRHSEESDAVLPLDHHFADGELFCGETLGLDVDIDERFAA